MQIQNEIEFSLISTEMKRKKIFTNNAHIRLMHVNDATLKHTAQRLNCDLLDADHTDSVSFAKGKAK